ncbi:MAG: ferritin [Ignavibacteriales bacterium]|nr:ferritin [Ignavibacteriales bacterium]
MINPKIEQALNKQLNEEFFSSYLYLSMSANFEKLNLAGFANWMKVQSQEEYSHAMKFYNYLIQKGGTAVLEQINKPDTKWENTLAMFEATYAHEQHITECINNLVDLALEVKDHATNSFLAWYVNEQVEEEANVTKLIEELKMVGENKTGLFMMDRELAQRVFVDATATAK